MPIECDFDMELGFRLRAIRQKQRMSQECLGAMLGVTFQQIQKYESGVTRMPPERIGKCAKIFNVPVGYFFGTESEKVEGFDQHVAAAIAALSSDAIAKQVYELVQAINANRAMPDKLPRYAA